jgi:glycosyltransferase involved in cell wall biosynthesis
MNKHPHLNAVLVDCEAETVRTFADGLEATTHRPWTLEETINNTGHGSALKVLGRYVGYFLTPLRVFAHRHDYACIVGWQQFYANIFAFWCRLFRVRKPCVVVSANFTYKSKPGLVGRIYYRFMKFSVCNEYVDFLHVPSHKYADRCVAELGIPREKFLVTTFGIPDEWDRWKDVPRPQPEAYTLSIGRSNRDFDFLVEAWRQPALQERQLVIISDTYQPRAALPPNVRLLSQVRDEASMPWLAHCSLLVIPIADGNIASGDTVLLTGMQFEKTVVVTRPSTLAEMYIADGADGVVLDKEVASAAERIAALLADDSERQRIGEAARQSYLAKFSRRSLGEQIGLALHKAGF